MFRKILLVVVLAIAIILEIKIIPAWPSAGVSPIHTLSSSPSAVQVHECAVKVTFTFKIENLCIRDLKGPFIFPPTPQPTKICVPGGKVNLIQQRESREILLSTSTILSHGCRQVQMGNVISLVSSPHPLSGVRVGYLGGWDAYQSAHRGIIRQVSCYGRTDFFTLYLKGGGKVCLADHGLIRLRLPPFTRVCGGRNTGDVVGADFSIHLKGWGDCASVPPGGGHFYYIYIRPLHVGAGNF